MPRIDICQTLEQITFSREIWEWLDLLGDVLGATQQQAMIYDATFRADTPYKRLLLGAINRDLSTLSTIYILLRWEQIHQAAAHVRLLCESLITLRYIEQDIPSRVPLFQDFAHVESYKLLKAILKWGAGSAKPRHVKPLEDMLPELEKNKNSVIENYTIEKKGNKRERSNWCKQSIAEQAKQCGPRLSRIYELIYTQLSAYIHGSAWSLRKQAFYSRNHYNSQVVLNDIATIVRTTLVVWEEWALFCNQQLNWQLNDTLLDAARRLEELDAKLSNQGFGA